MSIKSSYSGFKRTKWENKANEQGRKQVIKHYETLGKKAPKYVTEGNFTKSKLDRALKTLSNGYEKLTHYVTPTTNLNKLFKQYVKTVENHNRLVRTTSLSGRTEMEKMYLSGEMIYIPHIRPKGFIADKVSLRELSVNKNIKDSEVLKNRIKEIKKIDRQIKENKDSNFYNVKANKKAFKDVKDVLISGGVDSYQVEVLDKLFNTMTEFEKEIFIKTRLSQIKEAYLNEYEIDEVSSDDRIYNGLLYGMYHTMGANRGV